LARYECSVIELIEYGHLYMRICVCSLPYVSVFGGTDNKWSIVLIDSECFLYLCMRGLFCKWNSGRARMCSYYLDFWLLFSYYGIIRKYHLFDSKQLYLY
jgi:hypothetical protein